MPPAKVTVILFVVPEVETVFQVAPRSLPPVMSNSKVPAIFAVEVEDISKELTVRGAASWVERRNWMAVIAGRNGSFTTEAVLDASILL